MPKLRELIQTPPEPEGGAEEQLEALRDYLRKVTQELEYLLTHLEADNINDTTFERISEMIPRPYTGLPLMDGDVSAGTSAAWSRGNHRHPHDSTKADVTALEAAAADLEGAIERETDAREAHEADTNNPHSVTKAQVGLGNVADERQYSAQNPPPIPTPGEVGAVPVTRKINGHALSADVTLDHTDVGAIPATDKGSAGGVAELDGNGLVPSSQLPSYVDDVKDYPTLADFPVIGEEGKIYVAKDTNRQYRWSGSDYVEISKSLALGETSSSAYRGDRGKTAYDHSQITSGNPHNVTAAEVGLGNVANERQYSALNPPPLPTPADIGAATAQDLMDHVGDTTNPHGVTAAQAGARPDTWLPTAADVGARPDTWTPSAADVGARPDTWMPTAADVGAVPTTRTINGYDLSQDRSLDAADVGARPDTWTPSAADVGARPDTWMPSAADVGARSDTWVPDAEDVPYDNSLSGLTATDVQAAIDELSQGGGGGGPSPSAANPEMDGTAAPGTALTYARGDHVHPTDTSRAASALEINGHALTGDFDLTAADVGARADTWTPSAADVGARPDNWMPTAADVGALPSDGTAAAASTLAQQHKIFGSGLTSGWYAFAEITISNNLSRTYDILIDSTYHLSSATYQSGILRVFFTRSSTGVNTANVKWLATQFPLDNVRWVAESVSGAGKLTLYIYKAANASGSLTFRCISASDREGDAVAPPVWLSTAVAEPTQATAASGYLYNQAASAVNDGNGNNIAEGVLRFSSAAVSAGTAQQILSISDAKITADYVLAEITFADPAYITGGGSWASTAGSFTLTGTATAATTADILLVRKGN